MRGVGDGWHGVRRWHDGVGGGATQKGRGVAVRFDLGASGDAVAALEAARGAVWVVARARWQMLGLESLQK